MKIFKVKAYDENEQRACLNFLCPSCVNEAIEDGYDIDIKDICYSTKEVVFWCDNCKVGSEHPLYRKKINKVILKKGELK